MARFSSATLPAPPPPPIRAKVLISLALPLDLAERLYAYAAETSDTTNGAIRSLLLKALP